MATLSRTYSAQKLRGQVYTPPFVVEKILGMAGYDGPHVLNKSVLDPACGDGRFLVAVAQKIVEWSPPNDLAHNLSCLHGWDLDETALNLCRANLDAIAHAAGVSVCWNLMHGDALKQKPEADGLFATNNAGPGFDFVVGNPPYIRVQHLDEAQRRFIQTHFAFCTSGSTDIYLAFFELAHALLSNTGVCAFITPNTFLYTETARACREFFAQTQSLRALTNYGTIQLFDATTYSAITVFDKHRRENFVYEKARTPHEFERGLIDFAGLQNQKVWRLSTGDLTPPRTGRALKDICRIHVGITTLCDRAYIFPVENANENGLVWADTKLCGRVLLEAALCKPIVKGSTLKSGDDPVTHRVLFPYQKNEAGRYQIIPEAELRRDFPLTHAYLCSVKSALDKRDNGKPNPVAWYAFGRSQSLQNSWGKKFIFSPMNARPRFVLHEQDDCTVYSGYFIKYDGDYAALFGSTQQRCDGGLRANRKPGFPGFMESIQQKSH